jgi:hypothetical protein
MARRKITVYLNENTLEPDHAKLANAIWSVASIDSKNSLGVLPDDQADAKFLNEWYDKGRWLEPLDLRTPAGTHR